MRRTKTSPANMRYLMRMVRYTVKNYKLLFSLVLVFIAISASVTMFGMVFIQSLVDDYIMPMLSGGASDFGALAMALTRLAAVYAVGLLSAYGYNRLMVNISQGTMKRLRIDLFSKMESLPIKYFDSHSHGDIMSVYTNDVDTLRQFLNQSVPQIVHSAVGMAVTLVSMLYLNVPLAAIAVVMAAVMLLFTRKISGLSGGYFLAQQQELGSVDGYIEEMLDGQKVVKVFCHEEAAKVQFRALNEHLRQSTALANTYASIMMPINANIGNLSYVICAASGAMLALYGVRGVTVGTIIAFVSLNKSFSQPITQCSHQVNAIVMAAAGTRRVFELLEQMPEQDSGVIEETNVKGNPDAGEWAWKVPEPQGGYRYVPLKGRIVLSHVDFGYNPGMLVLHDISLTAEPGQKIAFVGSTGAGKTTITNLINRFYDITDGSITYDGADISRVKKSALRKTLGAVLQDTHLFTATVIENIRYGKLDASDEDCVAAAKLANADSFIERLPDGYQTMLSGDGANLSQGQRQLLSIARAAVANPPVLILDEATSSIDTRTELLVQAGMDALMHGRTTFVIAHRLSTVRNADSIMVLENGRIIERGTHDQLIEAKGRYYQLYTGNQIGE